MPLRTSLFILAALAAVSLPSAALSRLDSWLAVERRLVPRAVVTSGFHDWRSPSRYRSQAGLHNGYDIALPPGSRVATGWTGQVTAVTPWTDDQWGITVLSADGYLTTYGHLRPAVRVGDALCVGDPVGITVIDHVDIKMRGPDGFFVDFALAPGLSPPATLDGARLRSRIAALKDEEERLARAIASGAIAPGRLRAAREKRAALELALRGRAPAPPSSPGKFSAAEANRLYEEGAISRKERDLAIQASRGN
jgi:hypothetical protein